MRRRGYPQDAGIPVVLVSNWISWKWRVNICLCPRAECHCVILYFVQMYITVVLYQMLSIFTWFKMINVWNIVSAFIRFPNVFVYGLSSRKADWTSCHGPPIHNIYKLNWGQSDSPCFLGGVDEPSASTFSLCFSTTVDAEVWYSGE